jgi:glycosyltransferase involved in cell wall biosynthesis
MTILHIVAGLPAGSGIAEAVSALCRHLQMLGNRVTIATLEGPMSAAAHRAEAAGVRLVRYAPSWTRGLCYSRAMGCGLPALAAGADLVHVHSQWTYPVWAGCQAARRLRKPLVMSPHGCLDPVRLRRSAWKKRLAGLLDRHYLQRADLVQVTCPEESAGVAQYVGSGGMRDDLGSGSRVVVIPHGVEAPVGTMARAVLDERWPACRGKRLALFLSRFDPLKGLDLLVAAWASLAREFADWHLLLAGPDELGEEGRIRQRVAEAGLTGRITFCGPLYGQEKAGVLRHAQFLVLPTHHENFGLVVAEALACQVPVITTRGAPWAELVSAKCGWWVEIGVDAVTAAMREAMRLEETELQAMGARGKVLVERNYSWAGIAQRMDATYQQVTTGARM